MDRARSALSSCVAVFFFSVMVFTILPCGAVTACSYISLFRFGGVHVQILSHSLSDLLLLSALCRGLIILEALLTVIFNLVSVVRYRNGSGCPP